MPRPIMHAGSESRRAAKERLDKPVLLVENEPLIRIVLRHHLERWGYHVFEALNGSEALACVQAEPTLQGAARNGVYWRSEVERKV